MDRDTKCEVIKAVAAGMSDEEEKNGRNSDHEYCNDNE